MQEFYQNHKKIINPILFLLGLFLIYILFLNVDDFTTTDNLTNKKIELENIKLSGYSQGNLVWQITAKYVSSAYSIDHSTIENITDGILYNHGKVAISNLSAKNIRVNANKERLYATGGIRAKLWKKDTTKEPVDIWGEQLQYLSDEKKSYIKNNIKITDQKAEIIASDAQIDHNKNIISFSDDFILSETNSKITGEKLLVEIDTQNFQVIDDVKLEIKADKKSSKKLQKENSVITCDFLNLASREKNTTATLNGNIQIWQKDKQGIAQKGFYAQASEQLILKERVQLIFDRSDWLLDKETIKNLQNPEIKKSIYQKMTLKANQVELSTKTKDLKAFDNVHVILKNQEAKSDQADYRENQDKIIMTGNVKLKKDDGSWVQANKVIIDIAKESFEAEGQAESTVILKR